jgi:uncharacterized membrane protein YdjX (TVP38/TMEM64 family)
LMAAPAFVELKTGLIEAADAAVLGLREAGPEVFFVVMALLPVVGFPLMAFTLVVGPVFGPTLGAGWVIVWSLTAVVANFLLTSGLANRALRPLVSRLLTYFEFRLPDRTAGGAWQMALIVRLPLVPYLVVSTFVMAGYIIALVCGGEAITNGNGRLAFVAVCILVVSVAALQLLRQRTARRREAAAHRD